MESRSKSRLLAVAVWLVIIGIGLGAYMLIFKPLRSKRRVSDTGSESQYKVEVSLRLDSFSGYCILRSPDLAGQLKRDGIRLRIEDDNADTLGRVKALRDGKTDMAVFTVDSLLASGASIGEFPATIVLVLDETKGADAIVAYRSAVKSIQDLNRPDARFVATPNSPSEFLARVVIADFHLPRLPKDWLVPADGPADVIARMRKASKSEPRAYVLWEPHVSRALALDDVQVLLGSDKLKGYIVDVLVAERRFLKDHPELVAAVVKAYLRSAYAYEQSGIADLVAADAKAAGSPLSADDARRLVQGIQWKNTLENYAHFRLLPADKAGGLESIEDILTKVADVLAATGGIDRTAIPAPNTLFYDRILSEMKAANYHPGSRAGLVQGAAGPDEQVRGESELPALSDAEWDRLVPVGEVRAEPLVFRRGTAELSPQSERHLEALAARLKSLPLYYLSVVGHARAEGDAEANRRLAEDRARVAVEFLVHRTGLSPNRVRRVAAEPSGQGGEAQSVTFRLGQRPY